jgi:integrase
VNPLRLLPRGYSVYSAVDTQDAPARVDVSRDRRLLPAEEARVRLALSGVKREDRERALVVDAAFVLLFDLILETGLRLSEAYRLRVDQVGAGFLRVEGSKGHRGKVKLRTVPLKPGIRGAMEKWCEGRVGLVFPFWDMTPEGKRRATSNLSARFAVLFDYAQVVDFTEHDLRHEAACRWFELRDGQGRWALSEIEISRVMGWETLDMALRYASIRGEDLVGRVSFG